MDRDWILTEHAFDAQQALSREGLFTQGSGYLHIRGSLEEHLTDAPQNQTFLRMPGNVTVERFSSAKAKWGTYVPGVFGEHPFFFNEMINLPWFCGLRLTVDGESLDMENSTISAYTRRLDMRNGEIVRSFVWRTQSGHMLRASFSRFVSMTRKQLCCQKLTLEAEKPCEVEISGGIDADVRTSGYDHLRRCDFHSPEHGCLECTVETDSGETVTTVSHMLGRTDRWGVKAEERKASLEAVIGLQPGAATTIEKRSAVATSRDVATAPAVDVLAQAAENSYEELFQEQAQEWQRRWRTCDVIVEGDHDAQIALRTSLYHLLRCHVPDDPRVAIDAKGYAGDAYFGHFFWDTEMYMLPFYAYTDPQRAATLVDFRLQGLDGALKNAAQYGYRGARYPWESDSHGNECTAKANWQYRDHEIHVTGDVVYGIDHYVRASGDDSYFTDKACRLLLETARYWMDRMDTRPGDAFPSILGVMGPDEYTPITSNNSYTNRVAAHCLTLASKYGGAAGASCEEREQFAAAARSLPLPRSVDGALVLQCEEFEKLADPHYDRLWTDRTKPFASLVPQERLYRTKCMKQGDVLMLMQLFPNEFTTEEMQAAWDYYEPLCTHDSSLSAGIHALMALRLGLGEEAWSHWKALSEVDINPSKGGAAQGIHIANAAAAWMVAVMGFGGMVSAMETDTLTFRPSLPSQWKSLSFPLCWKGQRLHVVLSHQAASFHNRSQAPLTVVLNSASMDIPAGEAVTVPL